MAENGGSSFHPVGMAPRISVPITDEYGHVVAFQTFDNPEQAKNFTEDLHHARSGTAQPVKSPQPTLVDFPAQPVLLRSAVLYEITTDGPTRPITFCKLLLAAAASLITLAFSHPMRRRSPGNHPAQPPPSNSAMKRRTVSAIAAQHGARAVAAPQWLDEFNQRQEFLRKWGPLLDPAVFREDWRRAGTRPSSLRQPSTAPTTAPLFNATTQPLSDISQPSLADMPSACLLTIRGMWYFQSLSTANTSPTPPCPPSLVTAKSRPRNSWVPMPRPI